MYEVGAPGGCSRGRINFSRRPGDGRSGASRDRSRESVIAAVAAPTRFAPALQSLSTPRVGAAQAATDLGTERSRLSPLVHACPGAPIFVDAARRSGAGRDRSRESVIAAVAAPTRGGRRGGVASRSRASGARGSTSARRTPPAAKPPTCRRSSPAATARRRPAEAR